MAFSAAPFRVEVPRPVLDDLARRLAAARVAPEGVAAPGRDPNGAWAYGTDRAALERYLSYWREAYDWRLQEANLNALPHFVASHRGLRTHFIHARSGSAGAIPLLLVHGWPGSIVEFLKVIPLLIAAGFHVVVPSLPGYAWSEAPSTRGADVRFAAEHLHLLMLALGYEQYAAQGGDWGGIICSQIARRFPQHCVALHLNFCVPTPPDWYGALKAALGLAFLGREEREALRSTVYFTRYETGYQAIQSTKPQSLAYGLNDSPVGLLAWLLEKFQSWSDCGGGDPEASGITMDEILTNVMVYWVTQSIGSSIRLYYESLGRQPHAKGPSVAPGGYVAVPTGVLWARRELIKPPRHVVAVAFNLKHWSVQARGGHFFALEQPEALAQDVAAFLRGVLDFEECKRNPPKPGAGPGFQPGKYLLVGSLAAGAAAGLLRWRQGRL